MFDTSALLSDLWEPCAETTRRASLERCDDAHLADADLTTRRYTVRLVLDGSPGLTRRYFGHGPITCRVTVLALSADHAAAIADRENPGWTCVLVEEHDDADQERSS